MTKDQKEGKRSMEFFDKLGKKASEAYKVTADKTGKIAKETKMKLKISELKAQVNDIYEEIGKKVYEKHIREEAFSIQNEIEEKCTQIDVLSDEIDSLLKQCLALKDKKQCPKCYKEIEKEMKFCPNCGEKQTQEQNNDKEEKREKEESNLEKTVAVESDVEIQECRPKQEDTNLEKTVAVESNVEIEEIEKVEEEEEEE